MATPNYNLPTIGGNMTADVVRDMNALAEATDSAIKEAIDNVDLSVVNTKLDTHIVDYVKHPAYVDATLSGSNLYTVNLNSMPTEYTKGLGIVFGVTTATALNVQLRVGTLPAKDVLKSNGQVLRGTTANAVYAVRYNPLAANGNGAFILLGERGSGNAQPSEVLTGKTFTNDDGEFVGTMQVGSVIKSIQKGSRVIPTNTTRIDIPITTVNRSLSFIKTSFTTNSNIDQDVFPFVSFLDNSTISVSKSPAISGTGSIVLEWEVVEFVSGVKISSGGTGINASYFVETTVPQYDVNKALIFMSYSITQGGQASYGIKNLVSATKKDSTTIRFQRDTSVASGISTSISWFLVEFL